MKRRLLFSILLVCLIVIPAWIVLYKHMGACGPASDTPTWCLVIAMGPFSNWDLLAGLPDWMPGIVVTGLGFLLPIIVWVLLLFGLLSAVSFLQRKLMRN